MGWSCGEGDFLSGIFMARFLPFQKIPLTAHQCNSLVKGHRTKVRGARIELDQVSMRRLLRILVVDPAIGPIPSAPMSRDEVKVTANLLLTHGSDWVRAGISRFSPGHPCGK